MKALDWFRSTLTAPMIGILAFVCVILAVLFQHNREGADLNRELKETARAMIGLPSEPDGADYGLTTISRRSPFSPPVQSGAPIPPFFPNAQIVRVDPQGEEPSEGQIPSGERSPSPPIRTNWQLVPGLPGSTDRQTTAAYKISPAPGNNRERLKTWRSYLQRRRDYLRDIRRHNKIALRQKRNDQQGSNTLLGAIGRALGFSSR